MTSRGMEIYEHLMTFEVTPWDKREQTPQMNLNAPIFGITKMTLPK